MCVTFQFYYPMNIIILLLECASFFPRAQQMFPARRGQLVFAAESPSFTILCIQPLTITSHSIQHFFFGLFLSYQLPSVVPLLCLFLHPFFPHAPITATFALSKTLPISRHPSSNESSHYLFYRSRFSSHEHERE